MKRSPLSRKTPLRKVRMTPRRKVPRPKPGKSAADRAFHGMVAQLPCAACGSWPVEVHHVISDGFKRITRNHRLVIPLCPSCHRTGPNAIHTIGTPRFEAMFGISQIALARALWEKHDGIATG